MGDISEPSGFTLSEAQITHFLENGFVKVPQCFTREQAADFTSNLWTRLGMSPSDKSTWTVEKYNMPWHTHVPVKDFAPKAWSAICQLLGGEHKISCEKEFSGWSDGFIVNLGRDGYQVEDDLDLRCK
jgi:hypothetical protein